ncbi:NADPH-dependent ferric siderophore reductase, contains FAD-binding and SIP domains [Amycolatopsis pretoriensis]|uniref:NADPH-dependent ferric siderophore reductase, contains FAD-binding and SIP domains n=1 Tax=Amycolatopsis pretoriensis TaxID=218821 RepID=A0A1H5QJ72_9PSEU|nr:siderophore-interacting protein [Amycolatopsis pretoriensis]SEF25237.1 NADPH-dependent ferric siderophore reductase, contains FAD-binding and SIP domains [Amycolatopsis pretoriensis]
MIPKVRRPASRRMITLQVLSNTAPSPAFRTVTLGGAALEDLDVVGDDQAVRLFFPREGQEALRMPTRNHEGWMAEVLMMPKSRRPWVRNYTIRRARPGEIDIEFALHDGDAPAASWARRARPGDPAGVFDLGGSYLPPSGVAWQLLAGDESALPAILAILEGAASDLVAEVFLEVPSTADVRAVEAPAGVRVHWLPRDEPGRRPGTLALKAIEAAELPEGRAYTWVAGESALATGVRRHLVRERGRPKADIAFLGYWRHGRAAPG